MQSNKIISDLQSRQLELKAIMSASDDRAAKCFKMGTSFKDEYPEDWATYVAANNEYNENEQTLIGLQESLSEEYEKSI